jgi:Ca2+-binding RTX toxin-like protein
MSDVVANNNPAALLSGSYWNGIEVTGTPAIVTFSFPASIPSYDTSIAGFTPGTVTSFQPFTTAEQTEADQALSEWASASGLIFLQVAPGQGDINFQNIAFGTTSNPSYEPAAGIGFYPFGQWSSLSYPYFTSDLDQAGEVFMNSDDLSDGLNTDSTVDYGTMLHEIGHAIGLKHPTQIVTDFAAEPNPVVHDQVLSADDPALTVMATVGDSASDGPTHLRALDQAAAAAIYGPAGTGGVYTISPSGSGTELITSLNWNATSETLTRTPTGTDTVSGANAVSRWTWDATTGTLTQTALQSNEAVRGTSANDIINGLPGDQLFALDGNDVLNGAGGNDSLYGGPGNDTLNGGPGGDAFYVNSATTTVNESNNDPSNTVWSTVSFTLPQNLYTLHLFGSGLTGTANNQGDELFGDGTFATTLIGDSGGDYMVGGAGDDTIMAGTGPDLMFGEGGDNTFVFRALADAPVAENLNTIGDWIEGQDKIDLSGIAATEGHPLTFIGAGPFTDQAGQIIQVISESNTIIEGDTTGSGVPDFEIQLNGGPTLQANDFVLSAACYRAGTRILTINGEVAVENLAIGDHVVIASGEVRPVNWIGHRRVNCARHPDPGLVWPVLVRAGAFGEGQPHRDLFLSPDHAVLVEDVLIPIKHLINGTTIDQTPMDEVVYYHVELPRHEVLFAEGLTAESYLDTGNRAMFVNGGGALNLYPAFQIPKAWHDDAAAQLAVDEARVRPVWERLAARSRVLGRPVADLAFTGDAFVHLQMNGCVIRPVISSCRDAAARSGWYRDADVQPTTGPGRKTGGGSAFTSAGLSGAIDKAPMTCRSIFPRLPMAGGTSNALALSCADGLTEMLCFRRCLKRSNLRSSWLVA